MDDTTLQQLKARFPHMSEDVLRENLRGEGGGVVSPPKIPPVKARLEYLDPSPAFKSKTEEQAWTWLDRFEPLAKYYELLMVRLPGGNYTPDFTLVLPDAEIWHIECKGAGAFRAYKSGRSSKKSLKEAAHTLSWMGRWWVLIKQPKRDGGGWLFEEMVP